MKITAKQDTNLLDLLKDYFVESSTAKVRKMIMYGCVSYKGAVVKSQEMILRKGESVEYTKYTGGAKIAKQKTDLPVIFEDRDLIVVNKSGGVKFSSGVSYKGKTICSMTKSYLRRKFKGSQPLFPVHEVDDQESGLCLLARNKPSAEKLSSQWREIEKIYFCIVQNPLKDKSLKVNNFVLSGKASEGNYSQRTISLQYRFMEQIEAGGRSVSLIELKQTEGSVRDCREFLAQNGNPIVADFVFGDSNFRDNFLKICLVGLNFKHPQTANRIRLRIEPPRGFNNVNFK